MKARTLTEAKDETRSKTKAKVRKAKPQVAKKKALAKRLSTAVKRKTQTPSASVARAKPVEPSPIRRTRLAFQPIKRIQTLPEYAAAGLRESDTEKYLRSLSINTVDEFLGLIRGVPKELAEDLGTTEEKLV